MIGSYQLFALLSGDRPRRRTASFAAILLWVFLGVMIGFSDWHFITAPLMFLFAVAAAWSFLRLKRSGTKK